MPKASPATAVTVMLVELAKKPALFAGLAMETTKGAMVTFTTEDVVENP